MSNPQFKLDLSQVNNDPDCVQVREEWEILPMKSQSPIPPFRYVDKKFNHTLHWSFVRYVDAQGAEWEDFVTKTSGTTLIARPKQKTGRWITTDGKIFLPENAIIRRSTGRFPVWYVRKSENPNLFD